jgi:hypothetical protein
MNIYGPTVNYGISCGQPLTEEAQVEVNDTGQKIRTLFAENPRAYSVFLQILSELKEQHSEA